MKVRVRDAHSEVHAPAVILLAFCLLIMTACDQETAEEVHEPADTEMPSERTASDQSAWLAAPHVSAGERRADTPDTVRFSDMNDALHALFMHAARARDSEMGHEGFQPELADAFMAQQVRDWLALFQAKQARFSRGLGVYPEVQRQADSWVGRGDSRLSDHVWGVYIYHMHHRESWFAHHELDEAVRHYPLGFLTGLARNVYDSHYDAGRFYADVDHEQFDAASMMQGLSAAHAMNYAWVRWKKPGGEDDMGRLDEDRLAGWLGRTPEDLLIKARLIVHELDAAWDESRGFYDFGRSEYDLETLGNLLRGHKGFYELLYLFGDEADQQAAQRLFSRAADTMEALITLARPWGLPARLRFDEDGWAAAADTVDVAQHWELMAHLAAGFSFNREREGTARFMARERPELVEALAHFLDDQIADALAYQMPDGLLVSSLDWSDGEVVDGDHTLRAISRFMLGAGEAYGGSDRFSSPSDWNGDEAEANTRKLYKALLQHGEFVRTAFIEW